MKHNGYKIDGEDTLLEGAGEFLRALPEKDRIIFLTSRTEDCRVMTENFLRRNGIRFEHLICGAPYGERILVNDDKPSGLCMSFSVCAERDRWPGLHVEEDITL